MTRDIDLGGVTVLVTRPERQAGALSAMVIEHGGRALRLPLVEIEAAPVDAELAARLARAGHYDILIFVSVNAVDFGLDAVAQAGGCIGANVPAAAVGKATAEALKRRGITRVTFPQGRSRSEELLECELLQEVAGRRVLIFRGQDGRELLAGTLRRRGALVDYAPVYRRLVPQRDDAASVLAEWLRAERPVLVLTSEASARAFLERLPDDLRAPALAAPVVVMSERIGEFCRDAGWRGPVRAGATASDAALVRAVAEVSRIFNEQRLR